MQKMTGMRNPKVQPLLKWAGGKRQLLAEITRRLPQNISAYYEPFLGGGAVLLHLQPENAVVNDFNGELVNVYQVVRDQPEALISDLALHCNEEEYFYRTRELDRNEIYPELSAVKRASRIIYLNKTCYNGLFRVNQLGQFNAPFGKYKNPNIINADVIRAVSRYLNDRDVRILNTDFVEAVSDAGSGNFVYFDPPYAPVSDTASFTGYTHGGFGDEDQLRLKKLCDKLSAKGVRFLLSNSAVPRILELYKGYEIERIDATRAINSVANKRGVVAEVLVRNY